jgi:formylglycine-generating enzyme required for sulfatase activity
VLDAEVSGRRDWAFSSLDDRWWHAQLLRLITELETFGGDQGRVRGIDPDSGWGVARRRDFLQGLVRLTIEEPAEAWRAAEIRVAGNRRYTGLRLRPQLGLVPLGPDPESRLEEFWEPASGTRPLRDPETGRLARTEETGLVFVLIPGGTFWMGAQKEDPEQRNFDPQAVESESPVHELTLSAFFLSKDELTQGQWLRLSGGNPSTYLPGTRWSGHVHSLLHPVEMVTWDTCDRICDRFGLLLPTEAQWEYGCRAGTDTPWWTGREQERLEGAANLADAAAARSGATWTSLREWPGAELDDGYALHAPVGRYRANGFGLHDVHGNVFEWCRDGYFIYGTAARPGDGLRGQGPALYRVYRGGGYFSAARDARAGHRILYTPGFRDDDLGVRPARVITE